MSARQFCSLVLDGHVFGIDVQRVQEVLREVRMTPVPLAPASLAGLINLRGQVVTAFDLRILLGFTPRAAGSRPLGMIVRSPEGPLSLLVDEVGEVLKADESLFEAPPETLAGEARNLIAGAFKLKDRLLLALDMDRVLATVVLGRAGEYDSFRG